MRILFDRAKVDRGVELVQLMRNPKRLKNQLVLNEADKAAVVEMVDYIVAASVADLAPTAVPKKGGGE